MWQLRLTWRKKFSWLFVNFAIFTIFTINIIRGSQCLNILQLKVHLVSPVSPYDVMHCWKKLQYISFYPSGVAQIEKARPYFEALEIANKAQKECQSAATAYQRANGIHAAAKETISLAEDRFLTNSSSWQFDNAWQEMLNHATMKVCIPVRVSQKFKFENILFCNLKVFQDMFVP